MDEAAALQEIFPTIKGGQSNGYRRPQQHRIKDIN
jgi:hypothetical protein